MKLAVVLLALFNFISSIFGARILSVNPFPSRSQYIFRNAIFKALTKRGHDVVEYSPHPPKQPFPNYTHVEIHSSFEEQLGKFNLQLNVLLTI